MNEIIDLIKLLSPAEKRHFVQHLAQRTKRKDNKNIALFTAFCNHKEQEFRAKMNGNAYLALKKRLQDRLIDFVASNALNTEVTAEIEIIKKILVARKLLKYNYFKPAFKVLAKAEQEAIDLQHFSLLNEIYHSLIEYSYHELIDNQEELITRFQENQKAFQQQEQLNMAYAVIRKAFHRAEYQSENIDFATLLEESFNRFGVAQAVGYSFKSLYQLAEIANIEGTYKKNYHSINLLFTEKLEQLEGGSDDKENSLLYHIDLLYLIANIYLRKKDFKQSVSYLNKMEIQMKRFNEKYYDSRVLKYTNLLALNLNFMGEHKKAADLLDALIQQYRLRQKEMYNTLLIRIMIHFQQDALNEANKLLAQLQHTDHWYESQLGLEWSLHKRYIEILLHIELGNIDFVDSRIQSLLRAHGEHFKQKNASQVLPFLKLVKKYYHQPGLVNSKRFVDLVESSIDWKPNEQEDLFLMCFYAWLKSKMIKNSLYQTTIDLLN